MNLLWWRKKDSIDEKIESLRADLDRIKKSEGDALAQARSDALKYMKTAMDLHILAMKYRVSPEEPVMIEARAIFEDLRDGSSVN